MPKQFILQRNQSTKDEANVSSYITFLIQFCNYTESTTLKNFYLRSFNYYFQILSSTFTPIFLGLIMLENIRYVAKITTSSWFHLLPHQNVISILMNILSLPLPSVPINSLVHSPDKHVLNNCYVTKSFLGSRNIAVYTIQ